MKFGKSWKDLLSFFRKILFVLRHRDVARHINYIRAAYLRCQAVDVSLKREVNLEKAWKHISACSRCDTFFTFLVERNVKI